MYNVYYRSVPVLDQGLLLASVVSGVAAWFFEKHLDIERENVNKDDLV